MGVFLHRRLLSLFGCLLVPAMLICSCRSYTSIRSAYTTSWQRGDLEHCIGELQERARSSSSKNRLLWSLESGTACWAAGRVEQARKEYDAAEEWIRLYDEGPEWRLRDELTALLGPQENLLYRGTDYDRIMLSGCRTLLSMASGDWESARVQLNRALQYQRDAVENNADRLEELTQLKDKASEGELVLNKQHIRQRIPFEKIERDPAYAVVEEQVLNPLQTRLKAYADYVNPFVVFLDGLYFSHLAYDLSDLERARKSWERVARMSPGKGIEQDLRQLDLQLQGGKPEAVTYVVFASGTAPTREEMRFQLPVPLKDRILYIGFSLPRLQFHRNAVPSLRVLCQGESYETELLADMDAIIAREFKNAFPSIFVRTVISTMARQYLARAVEDSVDDRHREIQVLVNFLTTTVQSLSHHADTRSWSTLPQRISYARLPTPENGKIRLLVGGNELPLELEKGKSQLIYVRSVNDIAGPYIQQFTLDP